MITPSTGGVTRADRNQSRFAIQQPNAEEEMEQIMEADLRHQIRLNRVQLERNRSRLEELHLDDVRNRAEERQIREASIRSVVVTQNETHGQQVRAEVERERERERAEKERVRVQRQRNLERDRQMRARQRSRRFQCHVCNEPHPLNKYDQFTGMTVDERIETVNNLNLCQNCFAKLGMMQHFCNVERHGPCRRCSFTIAVSQ